MKNTLGNSVSVTVFGESHGYGVGAVLDGIAPGIKVDESFIKSQLALRKSIGEISTARKEEDNFIIVSGVKNGYTTGTPIAIIVPNANVKSEDYDQQKHLARPSHADYVAQEKYHGYQDISGGGHFSGRITAGIVAVGGIAISALRNKGIYIGTHLKECACIKDDDFSEDILSEIEDLNGKNFATISDEKGKKMQEEILRAKQEGDSVGGVLETVILNVPAGVGEPWFDTLEGEIAKAVFSVPAVKGVEFGKGFEIAKLRGSQANDAFCIVGDKIKTKTNNSGGINGGISNGNPIVFRTAIKPTPTIFLEQDSVDYVNKTECKIEAKGRHDPAIVHRARVVVDSIVAIVLCDALSLRYGTDYLGESK